MRRIESRPRRALRGLPRATARTTARGSAEFRGAAGRARHAGPQRDLERLGAQGKMLRARAHRDAARSRARRSSSCPRWPRTWRTTARSPAASVVTASASSSGREVMIRADDPSVKGGAWYPLTVKKIVRALDIAMENRLPVIHLCDSAGGFLPLQSELFADRDYGRPHLPQPVDPVEDGRPAARAGLRPLHGGRRLHPGLSTTRSSCAARARSSSAARRW